MFPTNILTETIQKESEQKQNDTTVVTNTPSYDWESKNISIYNGSPQLVTDIQAIKQWIILFLRTPRGVYKIYGDLPFGTSIRKLFGKKRLNNGYEESELEREISEGLVLCPAIKQVSGYNLRKEGKNICVDLKVKLQDGSLIIVSEDNVYTIK